MTDLERQNKSVVQRFGEALNSRNLDLLDELVAPDFVRHCQATPWTQIRSLDDFKRFLQEGWAAVPDERTTPRFLVAEGEYVAVYLSYGGTHTGQWGPIPASGKRFDLDVSGVFRMAEGRIAELWITWDNLAVLAQLGHWPPPGRSAMA
jgi:steroid delta-isomerase-like uncharacterized protein